MWVMMIALSSISISEFTFFKYSYFTHSYAQRKHFILLCTKIYYSRNIEQTQHNTNKDIVIHNTDTVYQIDNKTNTGNQNV